MIFDLIYVTKSAVLLGEKLADPSSTYDMKLILNASLNIFITGWIINISLLDRTPTDGLGLILSFLSQTGYGYLSSGGLQTFDKAK